MESQPQQSTPIEGDRRAVTSRTEDPRAETQRLTRRSRRIECGPDDERPRGTPPQSGRQRGVPPRPEGTEDGVTRAP